MQEPGKQMAPSSHEDVLEAARAVLPQGRSAWVVGGCVRDELLGLPSEDVDIVVAKGAEELARALGERLDAAVYSSSDVFGSWRVVAGSIHVDITPLRVGPRRSRAGVGDPLTSDLLARDFTINALAMPLAGGALIDPLGGAADLAARRLRLCSPSAFEDDPLRVIRLARLARGLGMTPERATVSAAASAKDGLARISGERVRDELSALLALRRADAAIRDLTEWGALAPVLPEVDSLRGVEQNGYHHRDVFGHSLEALSYVREVVEQMGGIEYLSSPADVGLPGAKPIVPVAWAVLLHDIGKPQCRAISPDGRVVFWNHDEVGSRMAVALATRLRMSIRFSSFLGTLVRRHLRLGFLVREQPLSRRALARYRRDVSPWVFESVVVSLCDRLATRGEKTTLVSIARHYRVARSVWTMVNKAPIPKLLSGEDVMETLALGPGPEVGMALTALEEEIDAGEVSTPDEARAFLGEWWVLRQADPSQAADEGPPGDA